MADVTFKRVFHPVGQGAFFTEQFISTQNSLHIVYDCGSMSRKRINEEILEYASSNFKNKHIACIFISHFDMDHVNGLDELRKNFTVNDRTLVFVPFFYEEVYVYLSQFDSYYLESYRVFDRFIKRTGAHLVKVLPFTNDERERQPLVLSLNQVATDYPDEILSGTPIHIQDIKQMVIWKYIPYNIIGNHTIEGIVLEGLQKVGAIKDGKFNVELLSYPTKGMSQEEKRIMSDKRRRLRRIFTKIGKGSDSKNINMNSLQLLSLPNNPLACTNYCRFTVCDSYFEDYFRWNRGYMKYKFENEKLYPGSCLYTGDTYINSDDFWKAFKSIVHSNMTADYIRLSLFQIPHHGSSNNYDIRILGKDRFYAAFTNFDPNRKKLIYDPNISLQFYLHRKPLILVTEDDLFRFEECWNLYV